MRIWAKLKTTQISWAGILRPVNLGLGILLLGLAGPALGGRQAPAVWVPLDADQSSVMVPYQETLHIPGPGQRPVPWTPEHLAAPDPGLLDNSAARRGLLPGDARRSETGSGPQNRQETVPARGRSFTLSDVLRDVEWRRQTAEQLRRNPAFKPRF